MPDRPPRARRGRVLAAAVVVLAAGLVALASSTSSACYAPECEGDHRRQPAAQGVMLDDVTWASGPRDGRWLEHRRRRAWFLELPPSRKGELPVSVEPYVSAVPEPFKDPGGGTFSVGTGPTADLRLGPANEVIVANNTCGDFWLRVIVRYARDGGAADARIGD